MNATGIISLALVCLNLIYCSPKLGNEKAIIPEDISSYTGYKNISYFKNELIGLEKDGKFGFLDFNGNVVIPFMYENAGSFSEGLVPVCQNGKFGYINMKNEVVIPFEYDSALSFNEGCAIVGKSGKYGVIDKTGAVKVPVEFSALTDEFYTASHKVFEICENQKYGLIDISGEVVIPVEYDNLEKRDIFTKTDTFIVAELGAKYGILDYSGNILLPFEYDDMKVCGEKTVSVKKEEKWAVLDICGNIIAPYGEKGYSPIGEGFFIRGSIFDDEGVALLNSKGEEILHEGVAVGIRAYSFGYIEVQINRSTQLIDFDGNLLTDFDYVYFHSVGNGYFHFVKKDGTHGIWNNSREILLDYETTDIFGIDSEGYIYAKNSKIKRLYVFSPEGTLLRCFEGNKLWVFEDFYIVESGEIMSEIYKPVPKK